VLKLVKDGRIVFTPKPEAGVYEFEGLSVLDKLLAGVTPHHHALADSWPESLADSAPATRWRHAHHPHLQLGVIPPLSSSEHRIVHDRLTLKGHRFPES
jgi:hypothetical protein